MIFRQHHGEAVGEGRDRILHAGRTNGRSERRQGERTHQHRWKHQLPPRHFDFILDASTIASSSRTRCSRSAIFLRSAGSFRKIADDFSHSRLSIAGYPLRNAPSGAELVMPLCPTATTLLPIFTWPATPTWPPSITPSPIVVLPAIPTWAASSAFLPTLTPCATCTRLSIFAPA